MAKERFPTFLSLPKPEETEFQREFRERMRMAKHHIEPGWEVCRWKGVPFLKNPVDLAIYGDLIWDLKPGLIVEAGVRTGASTQWLYDVCRTYGLTTRVIGLEKFSQKIKVRPDGFEFVIGDIMEVEKNLNADELKAIQSPWLFIEDAHESLLYFMRFFNENARGGDYLVIEDMYQPGKYEKVRNFISLSGRTYLSDQRYSEGFGLDMLHQGNCILRLASDGAR